MKNLFGLIVMLGLASTTVAQMNSAEQAATVWFFRPAASDAPQDVPTIYKVGGLTRQLGKIAPGEFFGYPVSGGTHVFSYTRAPARGQSLNLELKSGEQIFVEVEFRGFKRVPASDGTDAIGKTQPVPDARVLDKAVVRKFEPVSLASIMPVKTTAAAKNIALPPPGAPLTVVSLPSNTAGGSAGVQAPARSTSPVTRTAPGAASTPVASAPANSNAPSDAGLKLNISMTTGPVSLGSPFVTPVVSVAAASKPSAAPTVSSTAARPNVATRPASAPAASAAPLRESAATGSTVTPTTVAPPSAGNSKAVTAPVTHPPATPVPTSVASSRVTATTAAASAPSVATPAVVKAPPVSAVAASVPAPTIAVVPSATIATAVPMTRPAEPAPAARVNQPRPAWPEQPGSFYEVFQKATLQAVEKKQYVEAMVAFDRNYFWVLDVRGNTVKAFAYTDIKSAEYSYARSARWTAIATGAPTSSSAGGNRHWFMVQTQADYVLLQLDKENYRSVVRAFEIRAGQKVETETGEIN